MKLCPGYRIVRRARSVDSFLIESVIGDENLGYTSRPFSETLNNPHPLDGLPNTPAEAAVKRGA
jgi:hypothetical protein